MIKFTSGQTGCILYIKKIMCLCAGFIFSDGKMDEDLQTFQAIKLKIKNKNDWSKIDKITLCKTVTTPL